MTASELLDELSVKAYEEPLSALRESGQIADVSNPVCALMLVIDFETEFSMNGIADYLGNSAGAYADQTVEALVRMGCPDAAEKLRTILERSRAAGMTHEAVQAGRSGLPEYGVTSFAKTHGDKWKRS